MFANHPVWTIGSHLLFASCVCSPWLLTIVRQSQLEQLGQSIVMFAAHNNYGQGKLRLPCPIELYIFKFKVVRQLSIVTFLTINGHNSIASNHCASCKIDWFWRLHPGSRHTSRYILAAVTLVDISWQPSHKSIHPGSRHTSRYILAAVTQDDERRITDFIIPM